MNNEEFEPMQDEPLEAVDPVESSETAVSVVNLGSLVNVPKAAAIQKIQTMVDILERVRKAAIKMTHPSDWILYRDYKTDRTIAYLQDCGCQRVRDLFGISITPTTGMEEITGDSPNDFAYSIIGMGISKLPGQTIEGVEGLMTSSHVMQNPSFSNLSGAALKAQVRKHARANMDGNITRKLTGLASVPIETLIEAGLNTEKCIKGRGFKKTNAEAAQQMEEKCPECSSPLKLVPAGVSRSGRAYDAFIACTNRECNFTRKMNNEGA